MMVLDDRESRRLRHEDGGLIDLRRDALDRILWALAIIAFGLLLLTGVYVTWIDVTPAYVAIALAVVVGIVSGGLHYGVPIAASILVVGLVFVIAVSVVLLPGAPTLAALCLPVLIATVLLGTAAGGATLVLGGGLVAGLALTYSPFAPSHIVMLAFGLSGLVLLLSVVLWRSFYTVLDWSWASYAQAQERAAELRERQVELGRVNQSLVLAYEQIKQISGQLERARQAAEEARRLKSEFAASVSHELRTPLNLIIGLSELMVVTPHAGAPSLPDVYRADVEAIYRNACHISNLIDDVLDLSQIEAHHMGLLKEQSSLADVVSQAVSTVQTLFENTGLWLDVRVPADFPPIFVDPVRIRQILINLLNNAVRFTEEGGVTVSARIDAAQAVIDVSDTGTGISPEDLAGVFQEFWRSGEPKRGRRGSGLGLAVSKRFAELHGGNMWVSSTLGHGSTFSLALPLGEKAVMQEAQLTAAMWKSLERQSPAHPTVLLVKPEPEALRVFQRYLDGYQVAIAPNLASVPSLMEEWSARAILVASPAQRDAVHRILRHAEQPRWGTHVPIVTCALRTSKTLARELDVLDYLVKPVTRQQLRRVLRRFGRGLQDLVIVDDDAEMLHLLTRMVSTLAPHCQIRTGSDGRQAIDLLNDRLPNGMMLDLIMPGLDGYGVLEQIKRDRHLAGVPVAVITARGTEDEGLVADALEVSQLDGLHAGELCRWVRAVLEGRPPATGEGVEPERLTVPAGSLAY